MGGGPVGAGGDVELAGAGQHLDQRTAVVGPRFDGVP